VVLVATFEIPPPLMSLIFLGSCFLPDGKSCGSTKQTQKQVRADEESKVTNIAATNIAATTPERRVVTMEPSVKSFAGPSASRMDRSDPVMITDALADVRVKYVLSSRDLDLEVHPCLNFRYFPSYRYHINPKELGHGHYGVVRKCMDRETMEWYAIKSIRKAKVSKIEVLKREIQILKEVKHPNIIQVRNPLLVRMSICQCVFSVRNTVLS
jgi:Protein kinase domain